MSFSQHGTRAVCILSANGAISNVTLRQSATSGGTVTYEVCSLFYCQRSKSPVTRDNPTLSNFHAWKCKELWVIMKSLFSPQGRFEILSLSGSFLLSENGGHRSRTGGLSVSLAGPDGRVLGGSVAGLLTAASPVQVRWVTFFSFIRISDDQITAPALFTRRLRR